MLCANCGHPIEVGDNFYRAGKNGTVFCGKVCAHIALEWLYSKDELNKTMERHTRHK